MPADRNRITVYISSPSFEPNQAMEALAPELGALFGGASLLPHYGVWSDDGHEFKKQYIAGQIEPGLQIIVSVLPEDIDKALQKLKDLLQNQDRLFNWQLDWVHLEISEVEQRHFQIDYS